MDDVVTITPVVFISSYLSRHPVYAKLTRELMVTFQSRLQMTRNYDHEVMTTGWQIGVKATALAQFSVWSLGVDILHIQLEVTVCVRYLSVLWIPCTAARFSTRGGDYIAGLFMETSLYKTVTLRPTNLMIKCGLFVVFCFLTSPLQMRSDYKMAQPLAKHCPL